jgi:histo-blood group ABO system transferase
MNSITINIIATNKYVYFLKKLLDSIKNFFFIDIKKIVLIYTDVCISNITENFNEFEKLEIKVRPVKHLEWPYIALKKYEYILLEKDTILQSDMSFCIDADSFFTGHVDKENIPFIKGLIGTIHPLFRYDVGTPERNPKSKAYIPNESKNIYYAAGFYGGTSYEFIKCVEENDKNVKIDLNKNHIAIWHDESYLNRYFYENEPITKLDYPFVFAEGVNQQTKDSKLNFIEKDFLPEGKKYFRT